MSVTTDRVDVVAPTVPGATAGTVIGAAEILDRGNRRLARVPLRAEMSAPVEIPHDERCLVHAWSPYLPIQPVVVTGGRTQQALLSPPRTDKQRADGDTSHRATNGWVRLWGLEPNGHWTVRDPSGMATGEAATVATPPGSPAVLQVGGGRKQPVCTLVPQASRFTLRPTVGRSPGLVEVRSAADSGFTLLEALRLGQWGWAAVVEQVWWDDPDTRGTPLFDLAVAYLACRRCDLERIDHWQEEIRSSHDTGPALTDFLVIDAWLARRRGNWRSLSQALAQLAEIRSAPLAGEGLDLLAAELARHVPPESGESQRRQLRHQLAPYLRASLPSSLSSFVAAHPQEPQLRPGIKDLPGEALPFRVDRATSTLQIKWREVIGASGERGYYAPAAFRTLPVPDSALMLTGPEQRRERLIIEDEDPLLLWQLSRRLLDAGLVAEVSLVPGRDAVAVAIPPRRVSAVATVLADLLREGRVRHLGLSLGHARLELETADPAEAELILTLLLQEGDR